GIADDDPRVNPNGGAIALGHPLGMSGARLLLTATRELAATRKRDALCTMCIGVGQGMATIIERVQRARRLVRLLLSLAALIVAIVIGLRVSGEWWGTVYSGPEKPVEGASAMLLRHGQVFATVTTTVDGKFSIEAGKPDTSERVIVCKKGFEPA